MNAGASLLPPDFARHWALELDCKESSLVRLQGGINNRVYRCGEAGRYQLVIKGYAPLESGARDRMQAEVDFLRYAEQVAPGFTPELIHVDPERRCVVLEHLEGQAFPEGVPPPQEAVTAAVEFFHLLNNNHSIARQFIQLGAAEGFLRLSEHLDNIQHRLCGMQSEHLPAKNKGTAERLIACLHIEFKRLSEKTKTMITNGAINDKIQANALCVSPSDFGFHNAILSSTGTKFFDFEFSGWDDLAKTILDFTLQPRIPLIEKSSPLRESLVIDAFPNLEQRIEILRPILRLKWVCIILSVLNPSRLAILCEDKTHASLVSKQIYVACSYMERIPQFASYSQ